jgi:hypothetical protein
MKIIDLYKGDCPLNIEKMIGKLLRVVPEENLAGLHSIVIVNKSAQKKSKDAAGLYVPQRKNELPRIEIAIDNVFEGLKRRYYFFPFIPKFILARVLYHEIGHHYQFKHLRMKNKYREGYADKFCAKMINRELFLWMLFLRPVIKSYGHLKDWKKGPRIRGHRA